MRHKSATLRATGQDNLFYLHFLSYVKSPHFPFPIISYYKSPTPPYNQIKTWIHPNQWPYIYKTICFLLLNNPKKGKPVKIRPPPFTRWKPQQGENWKTILVDPLNDSILPSNIHSCRCNLITARQSFYGLQTFSSNIPG